MKVKKRKMTKEDELTFQDKEDYERIQRELDIEDARKEEYEKELEKEKADRYCGGND